MTGSTSTTGNTANRHADTKGAYVTGGQEFTRDTKYLTTRITADGRDGFPVEAGPLPPGGGQGLPLGQPGGDRATPAGSGTGDLDGHLRTDPRQAQLDL